MKNGSSSTIQEHLDAVTSSFYSIGCILNKAAVFHRINSSLKLQAEANIEVQIP